MRIINERGRLFGKINVFDFLVVLFLLCLVPLFYFGYKLLTKKPGVIEQEKEFIETEIDSRFIKVKPGLVKMISAGDKELNEEGQVIGEILSLGQSSPFKYEFDIGKKQKLIKEDPILKQIEAKLRLKAEVKENKPYYKDKEIRIGSSLEFKTNKYSFTIIPFEKEEKEFIETEIDSRFIKVKPELVKMISAGDKELNEDGQVIGEILSLGQSLPFKYEFDIGENQIITKEDPILKQIETKLRLKAEVKEDKPYYKDKEIRIGSSLEFKTNKYNLTAVVFEEEEEKEEEERIFDLNVTLRDLDQDMFKKISVGDKELDKNGNTIAEILSMGEITNSNITFDSGLGNLAKGENSSRKQISTKMRLRCQVINGNQLYFKGRKIESNTPLEFKTNEYKVLGLLSEDYKAYHKEKWFALQVKFFLLVPEIAKVVQQGDVEKDALGKTIARIGSIISNEPALVTTVDVDEDKFISIRHPFEKDITAALEVLCVENEGSYYFKSNLVKMGNNIVFNTDLYSITGLIVGLDIE